MHSHFKIIKVLGASIYGVDFQCWDFCDVHREKFWSIRFGSTRRFHCTIEKLSECVPFKLTYFRIFFSGFSVSRCILQYLMRVKLNVWIHWSMNLIDAKYVWILRSLWEDSKINQFESHTFLLKIIRFFDRLLGWALHKTKNTFPP